MNRDPKQVLTEWLVLEAQGGSETAFKDLHALWRADLCRMIVARTGRPEAADEVANEVWIGIARGLHRLDDPACFPRWALQIAERRSTDWVRRRLVDRKREAAAQSEAERLAPAPAASAEPPDNVLRVREAIARLAAEERNLVELYYGSGRSTAEIAEALALPVGTVKSRLFSVRETLKQILKGTIHE